MKFSIKDLFSKCDQTQKTADLITFTEEILKEKVHFLCNVLVDVRCTARLIAMWREQLFWIDHTF